MSILVLENERKAMEDSDFLNIMFAGNDTKLFRTMVIRNVTLEYDSLSGGYECHAFAGNMSKNPEDRFAFNVNVIKSMSDLRLLYHCRS